MVGYVAATGQTRYAPDVRLDEYYIACEDDTLSEVAIPLSVGNGWSECSRLRILSAMHFRGRQLRILQALCDHFAIAVHNARLFQQERPERGKRTATRRKRGPSSKLCCLRVLPTSRVRDFGTLCSRAGGGRRLV